MALGLNKGESLQKGLGERLITRAVAEQFSTESMPETDVRGLLTFQRGMQAVDFGLHVGYAGFVLGNDRTNSRFFEWVLRYVVYWFDTWLHSFISTFCHVDKMCFDLANLFIIQANRFASLRSGSMHVFHVLSNVVRNALFADPQIVGNLFDSGHFHPFPDGGMIPG